MSYKQNHYRTDYDLASHQTTSRKIPLWELSSKKLQAERVARILFCIGIGESAIFGLSAMGTIGKNVTKVEAQELAISKYETTIQNSTPAGKFNKQYLTKTEIYKPEYPNHTWLNLGGYNVGNVWKTSIGSACLKNTAYDITKKSNSTTTSVYAEVDPANHNDLIVHPNKVKNLVNLFFYGLDSKTGLRPAIL